MKLKHIAVAAALMTSGSAFAGFTGNVGVVSDYLFRGLTQTGSDAAVQGGIDYAHDSGLYTGVWVSNTSFGSPETDLYVGFAGKAGELGYDVGYIFYGYRDTTKANFSEVYVGLSAAGFSGKLYYSPELGATEDSAMYLTASYGFALSDTLTLTPQIGYSWGKAWEGTFSDPDQDNYMDYSLSLSKTVEGGYTFTAAVAANSEDDTQNKERFYVGLKKAFDL
ncbi:TorF family putative porin [Solimonas sp. SE-A11]|uniref:TorF family putative porin n=1 Tax=Solimonas sp. SE-A11 TaxID=3054954 RepID=UPI00259C695C|nr:TorF family putative porin [Solimonas sp. SE-A11]MDM4772941.1 TorF family putative porin [Solimonas sp. SE-A11]